MRHTLVLRGMPQLRVDARALEPVALSTLGREDVLRVALPQGREHVPVGEWFEVRSQTVDDPVPRLQVEGELARFDAIGAGLAAGAIEVHGNVGDALGLGMAGGELRVHGSARDLAGCAMRGGRLEVLGDVADFAASALPGEMDGMRGGTLVVHGRAGARLADRMLRGTVAVHGDASDFLASRMVAGTVAIGGRCGMHAGWGMRRGTLVFAGEAPRPPATFVLVESDVRVMWQLLARDLSRLGGAFAGLPSRTVTRWVGDLSVQGQGEWLLL
ncbi:formylmethanofuran dehydrogenase subunit C [Ramlibacter sp. USB13]|uniref:Formylmethanofuran dehydrogenase subunit C n=1 Tax=Ramlibacter cellulosilyticus TaxID=2764187 RepID=A0A923MP41_9BURK|nr:formylmethanofuran dehydrogenase subunit C [Ramlibacter cellulosilyticus]MBC5782236.1 formylmethanofuran dehydrogenase subunit C [Ramlibacter cellulosilyticus]